MIDPPSLKAQPQPDDECDICGKTLRQHNMGGGYPMCGIYPVFRATRPTPPATDDAGLIADAKWLRDIASPLYQQNVRNRLEAIAAKIEALSPPGPDGDVVERVARARSLALSGDFSPDDLGGDIGTMTLRNPDGPELLEIVEALAATAAVDASDIGRMREALEQIASGSKLGIEMFEQRVRERKDRLTWFAVNVLQDNLAACEGTARAALEQEEANHD